MNLKKFHIVYKTTCAITQQFYFGVHSTNDLDDGYLGSGIKFLNYLKKYGKEAFTREVIKQCDSREDAFHYEKQLLTEDLLQNNMCLNLTEGGKGIHHKYGEDWCDRISNTRKVRINNGLIVPTKHTEEHKQKLREYNPGGEATARAVYQIDATTGEVIKEWKSTRQAGISLNIKTWRNISTAINKNRIRTVYGFYWRWVGDPEVVNNKLVNLEELNAIRLNPSSRNGKRIQQLDETGTILKEWNTMGEAEKYYDKPSGSISYATKTGKICAGFYWRKISNDNKLL